MYLVNARRKYYTAVTRLVWGTIVTWWTTKGVKNDRKLGYFWTFLTFFFKPKEYTEYTYMILYHFLNWENLNKKYLSKFYMIWGSEICVRSPKFPHSRHGANLRPIPISAYV